MDAELRQMIDDAIRLDDEAKASLERFEREHPQLQRRPAPAEVVRQTYEPPPAPQQQQQQQQRAVMDAVNTTAWNEWFSKSFNNHVRKALDEYTEAATDGIAEGLALSVKRERALAREHVADEIKRLRSDLDAEAKKLRAEISGLRTDMIIGRATLRGEIHEVREATMKKKVRVT